MEKELYLKTQLKQPKQNHDLNSIYKVLTFLGAPHSEVYKPRVNGIRHTRHTRLYERMNKSDVLTWLENLWAEYRKRWHPDRHLHNKGYYAWKFAQGQEAYERGVQMLK